MQSLTLIQGYYLLKTDGTAKANLIGKGREILTEEPGLSVKELSDRFSNNHQFMAGMLKTIEERGEGTYRQIGSARIYYAVDSAQ